MHPQVGARCCVDELEHARNAPIGIGPVLEDHVDEEIAEEREAAHGLRFRHRKHGGRQRKGDLILHDLRPLPGYSV